MFQAIAALVGSGINLGSSVNTTETNKYQRYLTDRNQSVYAAQQARIMRTYTNMILIGAACLIAVIIVYFVSKK